MSGLGLRTAGRAKQAVGAVVERLLTEGDIESLKGERGVKAKPVVALRERHHALARLLAEGVKPGEAALMLRLDPSRISILQGDSSFKELVLHYRGLVEDQFVDFQRKLAELGLDAAHLLQERMEDAERAEQMSDALLLQVVSASADRTGHGPSQKTEMNIKIGLASRLQAAKHRIEQMRDVTPSETSDE